MTGNANSAICNNNNNNMVKLYKSGAFIEAYYDIFFNYIIEYDITNEGTARFIKKILLFELETKYVAH